MRCCTDPLTLRADTRLHPPTTPSHHRMSPPPQPPWTTHGGAFADHILRLIAHYAVGSARELHAMHVVSTAFHRNMRCTPRIYLDGVRSLLERWVRMLPEIPRADAGLILRPVGRNDRCVWTRTTFIRHVSGKRLLHDMEAWLAYRLHCLRRGRRMRRRVHRSSMRLVNDMYTTVYLARTRTSQWRERVRTLAEVPIICRRTTCLPCTSP